MLTTSRLITTIDSHTAGEGTRLVTAGLPEIPGRTMAEKLASAAAQMPWAPRLLLLEPRGHKDLFGAILVPPCNDHAQAGLLFMDNRGYEPMCGHGLIGAVTCLLETGVVPATEPLTELAVDTPAGLVRVHATVQHGRVHAVAFDNAPAFVYRRGVRVAVPPIGELEIDIAFGGNFFALVHARQLPMELRPANAHALADLGMRVLEAANRAVAVRHPDLPDIDSIIDLRFYVEPGYEGADSRNVVVLGDHMVDRSPCGTGTCAELALRYLRGELGPGQTWSVESIIGTRLTGEVVAETHVGRGAAALPAILPRITGRAFVTGLHQFVLDPEDPFPQGFMLT